MGGIELVRINNFVVDTNFLGTILAPKNKHTRPINEQRPQNKKFRALFSLPSIKNVMLKNTKYELLLSSFNEWRASFKLEKTFENWSLIPAKKEI